MQNRVSSRKPRNGHDPELTSYIPMIPIKVSQNLKNLIKMHQNFLTLLEKFIFHDRFRSSGSCPFLGIREDTRYCATAPSYELVLNFISKNLECTNTFIFQKFEGNNFFKIPRCIRVDISEQSTGFYHLSSYTKLI